MPKFDVFWKNLCVFGHLIAFFFNFFNCGWMMEPNNTFLKDCMRIGDHNIGVHEVFGAKIAIFGQKKQFLLWRFQTHHFRALKLLRLHSPWPCAHFEPLTSQIVKIFFFGPQIMAVAPFLPLAVQCFRSFHLESYMACSIVWVSLERGR